MPGSGRRRQARTPWHRRVRWDLLGWSLFAAVAAAVILGLTGGSWIRAGVLALLVLAAGLVLALLSGAPSRHGGERRDDGQGP